MEGWRAGGKGKGERERGKGKGEMGKWGNGEMGKWERERGERGEKDKIFILAVNLWRGWVINTFYQTQ
jgi:hypothetical protein